MGQGSLKLNLVAWANAAAGKRGQLLPRSVLGLYTSEANALSKRDDKWLYFDHSYFNRGWRNGVFRCTVSDVHLTRLIKRPDDRLRKFDVDIKPWRKTGNNIVVIPLSPYQAVYYEAPAWNEQIVASLSAMTDRPVIVSGGKAIPLERQLADAWAVVTYASAAGIGASLMGVPVFSTKHCPSYPVNAGPIENIEAPKYSERRHEMACGLAYASWHVDEIDDVDWGNYEYGAI